MRSSPRSLGQAFGLFLMMEGLTALFSPKTGAQTLPPIACAINTEVGLQGQCGGHFLLTSASWMSNRNLSYTTSSYVYYFAINNAPNQIVNVQVNYVAHAIALAIADPGSSLSNNPSACGDATAYSQANISIQQVYGPAGTVWSADTYSSATEGGLQCGSQSQGQWLNQPQQSITIPLSTSYTYIMILKSTQQIQCTNGSGQNDSGLACAAWAYVDPQISVDAAVYPNATISFSQGVSNATTPSATIEALGQAFLAANTPVANSTDGPIPLWALGALAAGITGIASRRIRQA